MCPQIEDNESDSDMCNQYLKKLGYFKTDYEIKLWIYNLREIVKSEPKILLQLLKYKTLCKCNVPSDTIWEEMMFTVENQGMIVLHDDEDNDEIRVSSPDFLQ